jgi:hypothetical protein
MEDFFETLFPFLMVAVVLGSRLFLMIRRRNRGRQEKRPAPAAPPKSARGFVPWEDESREAAPAKDGPAQPAAADEDESFSAWNLSVDDAPAAPPAPVSRPSLPETPPPDPFAALSARFGGAAERLAAASPDRATLALDRVAAPPERVPPARASRPAPKSPQLRFRGLSPLQQAVVWAEILGAPKGF